MVLEVGNGQEPIDIDVYLTYQHELEVNDDEVVGYAVDIGGVKCAHLVHLLILKIDNYLNFDGDQNSAKFNKVLHDIVQVIGLIEINEVTSTLLKSNLNESRLQAVKCIAQKNKDVYDAVCQLFQVECFGQCIEHMEQCA